MLCAAGIQSPGPRGWVLDLLGTIKTKISALSEGDYTPGLKAVLRHIETAFRHLERGQTSSDDAAFTDAIYRTNQAFEGSVKEAYRVLGGRDPSHERPYEIERYLEGNNLLRTRVLKQLTNYRTEWRNPSTHDYKLDFDESEAFLAIVSVCAFACLLIDLIAEHLSFVAAKTEAEANKIVLAAQLERSREASLVERTIDAIREFCRSSSFLIGGAATSQTELQIIGALHGFLSAVAPDLKVESQVRLPGKGFEADLLVGKRDESVVIEVKRYNSKNAGNAVGQIWGYLLASGLTRGVLLLAPSEPGELAVDEITLTGSDLELTILRPAQTPSPVFF